MGKQIWEIEFKDSQKKYVEANGIDDATQKAIDWSQKEFDEVKKEIGKRFDENEVADNYLIVSARLFVETDI